ncbi:MAG: response regulator [Desulfobulbaceae bacterium]|nr:response regulator [Desulfobulbaceae bacterium]
MQVSPQESLAREKESSAHGLIKLEAEFLKTMGFDQGKVRRKSIAVWGTGIIRDEFSIPVGIYIAGKLMDDLSHFFQGLYESIDAATILYVDGTPIDFVGLDNIERENNERSLPEISQSEMEKIYDNNQPTNLILSFPPERYLSACSSLKDVEQNKIGILCSGIPESQIEKVQQPLLVHGIETQKILQRWLLVSGVILVLISILLARTIAMGITKPLENVVEFTDKLEDGDLSRRLNTSSKDEIGALSKSIDTMLDNLNIALREKEKLEGQLRQAHKMEAIGTMAGGIAHDFNNLLAVILGYTDLAKEDLPDSHPSKSSLEQVLKAGIQARDLIKQILSFSRKEAQELVAVEIHLIVKEALKLLRASIPTTIEIKPNIDTHCGYILADPSQVHQVLINLCTNASHAMEEDGGVLEVGLKRVNIDTADLAVKLHLKQGPYIVLSVKDSGIGIEDAVQDRIFDPYFTTKEVGKGSGMGLAVVVGVVKCHNGSVIVDSKPGKGTTFYVYFPRVDKEIDMEVNDSGPIPTGNERILVVDDEEHIADMTKRRLELLGYQVTTKTSSIEALDLIRARPDDFDLIITDQTMPRVTGEQLAQKIMEFRPNIPIILCTGYSSKIDAQKADAVGIKAFVMKPVDKVELAGTIRNILDNQ